MQYRQFVPGIEGDAGANNRRQLLLHPGRSSSLMIAAAEQAKAAPMAANSMSVAFASSHSSLPLPRTALRRPQLARSRCRCHCRMIVRAAMPGLQASPAGGCAAVAGDVQFVGRSAGNPRIGDLLSDPATLNCLATEVTAIHVACGAEMNVGNRSGGHRASFPEERQLHGI